MIAATFEMYRELGSIMRRLRAPVDDIGAVILRDRYKIMLSNLATL